MTIVIVVGDARQRNLTLEPMPECYMPYRRHSYAGATLNIIHSNLRRFAAATGTLRRLVAENFAGNAGLVYNHGGDSLQRCGGSAVPGAVVCGVCRTGRLSGHGRGLRRDGVFGHTAISEIGLRMALGASRSTVLQLILNQGLMLAVVGLTLGLAGAVAATRLLTTVLKCSRSTYRCI